MTKTVLVPLDGSPTAERALPTAAWLSHRFESELHLISTTVGPGTLDQQAYLDAQSSEVAGGAAVTHVVGHRFPAPGILETLAALPDPVVCMTTRGSQGWTEILLGSVTDEVLRGTTLPVVLLGPRCTTDPGAHDGGLVVGVDGSEESFAVLPTVADWATRLDRPIDVVATAQAGAVDGPDPRTEAAEELVADAVDRLTRLGVGSTPHVLLGPDPSDLLVGFAESRSAPLIAIGTHGRGGLSLHALGHVATDIVRASPIPVLVRRLRS